MGISVEGSARADQSWVAGVLSEAPTVRRAAVGETVMCAAGVEGSASDEAAVGADQSWVAGVLSEAPTIREAARG